jgi:RNA polymerase sigma-70 factor (ECF subfamily)
MMPGNTPEEMTKIVERAIAGDREAFGLIYQEYFTPVYRYILFRVRSKEDADELTQEVFLKALGAFTRYEAKRENPLPFFYTIAKNAIIDRGKKLKSVSLDDEIISRIPDGGKRTDEEAIHGEELDALRISLAKLPDDQREALELRFMGDLPGREVAKLMGKTEEAVRQLQSRGLRVLREHFSESYGTR